MTCDIVYVEAKGRKVIVHTSTADLDSTQTLQFWIDHLPQATFFQSHRSYIVNMAMVTSFDHELIYLCDGQFTAYLTRRKFPEHLTARAILTPRKKGVLSGVNVAAEVFRKVDPTLKVEVYLHDGEAVAPGAVVMLIEGSARSILGAERTALNFIQRLSGVATLTRQYVKAVSHTSARILDTRKTTPGYRLLEKAAVLHGGGTNHRMGLYDRAMVKDNHLMTDGNTEHLQECISLRKAA